MAQPFTWKGPEITSFEQLFPALRTCEDQNELADFMNLTVIWSVEDGRSRDESLGSVAKVPSTWRNFSSVESPEIKVRKPRNASVFDFAPFGASEAVGVPILYHILNNTRITD